MAVPSFEKALQALFYKGCAISGGGVAKVSRRKYGVDLPWLTPERQTTAVGFFDAPALPGQRQAAKRRTAAGKRPFGAPANPHPVVAVRA